MIDHSDTASRGSRTAGMDAGYRDLAESIAPEQNAPGRSAKVSSADFQTPASRVARAMLKKSSRFFVPLGQENPFPTRTNDRDLAMDLPPLPLCSFGPGGNYIVDWQVKKNDLGDPRRALPP